MSGKKQKAGCRPAFDGKIGQIKNSIDKSILSSSYPIVKIFQISIYGIGEIKMSKKLRKQFVVRYKLHKVLVDHFKRYQRFRTSWPDKNGRYWCGCPMCWDYKNFYFSIKEDTFVCFGQCEVQGSLVELAVEAKIIDRKTEVILLDEEPSTQLGLF
jgi:hypothetical protein